MRYNELAAAILAVRTRKEQNISEAAREAGVSRMTMSRWCMGQRLPPVAFRLRLARYLGMDPDDLNDLIASEEAADGQRDRHARTA